MIAGQDESVSIDYAADGVARLVHDDHGSVTVYSATTFGARWLRLDVNDDSIVASTSINGVVFMPVRTEPLGAQFFANQTLSVGARAGGGVADGDVVLESLELGPVGGVDCRP
jgi:hypothetical protein